MGQRATLAFELLTNLQGTARNPSLSLMIDNDAILDDRSGTSPLEDLWKLDEVESEGGPTMTVDGTMIKLLVLLLLFIAGFLFSWQHFHLLHLNDSAAQKIRALSREMPAWQGFGWVYIGSRYPLYGCFLFFLSFTGCFLARKGLMLLAPICVILQGVSYGAFEYVLMDTFPGITLLCGLLVAGVFLSVFLVYWIGLSTIDDRFTLFVAGAAGGLAFAYLATVMLKTFDVNAPYLHQIPIRWAACIVLLILTSCGMLVLTLRRIQKSAEAGAPKWMEWRAATCLLASFLIVAQLLRRLLLRRSNRQLLWDSLSQAANGLK